MKSLIILLFAICCSILLKAQEISTTPEVLFQNQTRNIVFTNVEYYGLGGSVNISYERVLVPAKKFDFSVRGTFGRWAVGLFGLEYGNLYKLTGNMLFFEGNHHLELDLGAMLLVNDNKGGVEAVLPDMLCAYTFKKPDGHFVFKGGVGILGFLSVGIGYAF